ncbi:MAG: ABC transporter permease [Sporolactobacillus sp.]|nr:ABC transporter permease [Sporolactobacillus sp.]
MRNSIAVSSQHTEMNENIGKNSHLFKCSISQKMVRNKMVISGMIVISILSLVAIFSPLLAPYNPYKLSNLVDVKPSYEHLLGTDSLGRDVLSRLLYASRISLMVGLGVMLIGSFIGTTMGLLSGYLGGIVDMLIMRLADVFMTFSPMIILLVVAGIVGPGFWEIILVLGVISWPTLARIVRGNVLSIKEMNYVRAARLMGINTVGLIVRHILPNVAAPILVNATFKVSSAIISEAGLSFLGLGIQPPTASWGNMLTESQSLSFLTTKLWQWMPPGILIVVTVIAFNCIGEGFRSILNDDSAKN